MIPTQFRTPSYFIPLFVTIAILMALLTVTSMASAQTPNNDATLSSITVDGTPVPGFSADRASYEYGVASTVTQVTVAGTPTDSSATVAYSGTDADTIADGHQVELTAGANVVTITVTAEDRSTTKDYTLSVNRGVATVYGWKAVDDIDTLIAAGNTSPGGVWSDATTMWVVNTTDRKLYAYDLTTRARISSKDIALHTDNGGPKGAWSDDTTIWVADSADNKVYAYTVATSARDTSKEFDLGTDNELATGIWSDGTTMWVADQDDNKLYAYTLDTGAIDADKDITLHSTNFLSWGLWSDGTTIWVSDWVQAKIFAYTINTKARDSSKEFNTLSGAGNDEPAGIWSDGTTMWVADTVGDKIHSYNMPPSGDVRLSAITVDGTSVGTLYTDRRLLRIGVGSAVTKVTIDATANHSSATVTYSGTDADTIADGHQVELTAGANVVTITVTAEDGSTTEDYTLSVNRSITDDYGWKAIDDFNHVGLAGNDSPEGIWSNGATMWVADSDDDILYAYDASTKARDPAKDIALHTDNGGPRGLWSDDSTIWVVDNVDNKIYAYNLSTKAHDADKGFDLSADNNGPWGVWSDDTTIWVFDRGDRKAYAYTMAGIRDDAKDFDLYSANTAPAGVWSNGNTIWVSDTANGKIFAYSVYNKSPDSSRVFDTLTAAGNDEPGGIWSDGATMWVADSADGVIYSYNMPTKTSVTTLSVLSVDGVSFPGFVPGEEPIGRIYKLLSDKSRVTLVVIPTDLAASVEIFPVDADGATPGHQLNLNPGRNSLSVRVTAETGAARPAFYSIVRGVSIPFGWRAVDDFDALADADNDHPRGIWSDGATMWVTDSGDDKVYAYTAATRARDSSKDFDLAPGNDHPRGIWSDNTTIWVVDSGADKAFAYTLSSGVHDPGKDFSLDPGNTRAYGVWSDNTTIWVVDSDDSKLYAYAKSTRTYDSSKDIELHSDNDDASGAWSDGILLWVADRTDDKIYAYRLSDKARVSSKDFNTLGGTNNTDPTGVWSDGTTLWVADDEDSKIYSYNLPGPDVSSLRAEPGDRRVVLTWEDPDDATIIRYQYRVSADGGTSWSPDWTNIPGSDADTLTYTVTGLINGTEYTFEVREMRSGAAGEVGQVTSTPAALPTEPSRFDAAVGNTRAVLTWANPNDRTITHYQLRQKAGTGLFSDWADIPGSNAGTTTHTVESLTNGTEYTFEVRAVNHIGSGGASTATVTPNVVPDAPTNLSADAGDAGITFTWNDPSDSSITRYQYRRKAGTGTFGSWRTVPGSDASTVTYTAAGLTNAVEYTYQIRAVNSAGPGPSAEAGGTPQALAMAPANLRVTPGDRQVTLTWSDPNDPTITKYQIRQKAGNGSFGTWTDIDNSGPRTISHVITGLTNDTEYTFEIRGFNARGAGHVSRATATPAEVPDTDPPRLVDAMITGTSLELTFNEALDSGTPPDGSAFRVRAGSTNLTVTSVRISGAAVMLTVDPAAEHGQSVRLGYTVPTFFPIRDESRNNVARISNRAVTNNSIAPVAPSAPRSLTATPQGETVINLSWNVPASDGRARITGYRIEVSEDAGNSWSNLVPNTRNTDTRYAHTRLSFGTTRHYRVSAINRAGTSGPSNVASATTEATPTVSLRAVPGERFDDGDFHWQEYDVRIEFNRPVRGKNPICNGLTVSNATRENCSFEFDDDVIFDGDVIYASTWIVTIRPILPHDGDDVTMTASLRASVARDRMGGTNRAAVPITFTARNQGPSDNNPPYMDYTSSGPLVEGYAYSGKFTVYIFFTEADGTPEAVNGFTQSDIRLRGGRVASFTPLEDQPAGHRYRVEILPNEPSGQVLDPDAPWLLDDIIDVTVSVPDNAATDDAGNGIIGIQDLFFTAKPRPTVEISGPADDNGRPVDPTDEFEVTVIFSEPITGFAASELIIRPTPLGGDHGITESGNAEIIAWDAKADRMEYVATVKPTRVGAIDISVAAGVGRDADNHRNLQPYYPTRIYIAGVP